ncbi:DUF3153 domain-containing protein [Paenibacillus sp. JX-17]|uniref:DUF3153 domain-containing protein n=1 Tax=Paenibacillus lacisoli TaxID=3064525 RepID=A0ABT9CDI2_9BACL|nr:DUF3153 domain-containing protein [Paenibacillus sp. JX-17]MDO7907291.1 DUF3153 domain-containing protein [Paenibacillus sp. JX-17]
MYNSNKFRRAGAVLISVILLLTLSACARGEAHATVHVNGSVDLDLSFSMSDSALQAVGMSKLPDNLFTGMKNEGFQVEPYDQDGRIGFNAHNKYEIDRKSAQNKPQLPEGMTFDMTNTPHFFTTTRHVTVTADLLRMTPASASEVREKLNSMNFIAKRLLENQLQMDFKLTLPVKPGENNADATEDGGKTLVWHISALNENTLELSVNTPNIRNIAITGGIVLLLIIIAVIIWIRSRRRKAAPPTQP